jgi:large subunit ribosomal protein L18
MIGKASKDQTRQKIHSRIRKTIVGTSERPRLSVYRSVSHVYAQVIDDTKGTTIVSATSVEKGKGVKGEKRPTGGNVASAKEIGKLIAERAKEKGIKKVVFDRGGYLYHGRVKALADAAREAGLEF